MRFLRAHWQEYSALPPIKFCKLSFYELTVKQLMVKKVRDYRAKVSKEFSLCRNYIIKLKAAKLSRFLSQISVKFFNISQK